MMQLRGRSISAAKIVIGTFVALFLIVSFSDTSQMIGSAIEPLCTGWFEYLPHALARAKMNGSAGGFALATLLVLLAGSHVFLRWLYRQLNNPAWKIRWTLGIAALVFLLLLGGMSIMGIAHQTGWLLTSPRLTERRHDASCAMNMHEIALAISLYCNDNAGNYPPDLSTLLMNEQLSPWCFVCDSSDDRAIEDTATTRQAADSLRLPGHCSYIYLGKGLREPVPASQAILIEPPRNHAGDGMNVLFGDGHVEWVDRQRAAEIFDRYCKAAASGRAGADR